MCYGEHLPSATGTLGARQPPRESIMAIVLPGWFDDSTRRDSEQRVAALGGCVGAQEQWAIQDAAWKSDVLAAFDLSDYHAKEFATFKGPYAQFKGNDAKIRELSDAIIGTFKKSQIRSFGSMVRLDDLAKFNRVRGRQISHYALNIYACMLNIRQIYRQSLIGGNFAQLNLDISNDDQGTTQAIKLANLYAETHSCEGPIENIIVAPMPRAGLAKVSPALQAADFVAGEMRRFLEDRRDFYDCRPDGESTQDLRNAMTKWSEETGKKEVFRRGSFRALMSGKPYATPHAWTFNYLCSFDDERQGVWVPKDRHVKSC
jgi:hypothetical protein